MNIYIQLTREFNADRLRAIISSGQAVVLHRLAIMSKDGDWILREDEETMEHVLGVLSARGARYRFGAPLDVRWMSGGWSAHMEFRQEALRVRTDFVTRPPRIVSEELDGIWLSSQGTDPPYLDATHLAEVKKTNREKDYAVLGELARLMSDPADRLLYSRSARDLMNLAAGNPDLAEQMTAKRPLLEKTKAGRDELEAALDAERRALIRVNENRLAVYARAAVDWAAEWPHVANEIAGCSLDEAHKVVIQRAQGILPYHPTEGHGDD